MSKMFIALSIVVISGLFSSLSAQDYKLALGIRFSTPAPTLSNSISVKYFISQRDALEGLLSFGSPGSRFGIGGLFEVHELIGSVQGLTWFYGGGGYLGFQYGVTYLGPTGVIGIDYKFQNVPLNLSLDWKPELDILPVINFVPDALGLSVRFAFK